MFNNQFNPYQMPLLGQGGGQPQGQMNDPRQMAMDKLSSLFPGGFQNWLSAKMGGAGGWNTQVNPAPQPVGGNMVSSIMAKLKGLPIANTPMMGG